MRAFKNQIISRAKKSPQSYQENTWAEMHCIEAQLLLFNKIHNNAHTKHIYKVAAGL